MTELFDAFFRANMLTKAAYDAQQRDQGRHMWVVAGVIITAVAMIFAVSTWWNGKHEAKPALTTPASAASPLIIQLPPYPTLPAKK